MFQFFNPIWLSAIGAIIIPLAIHLWNIKKGKTLKIGSIHLLAENARQSSSSYRLQNLWLLFLRCMLLIILALLLAGPLFIRESPTRNIRGWILIDRAHLDETYSFFQPRIDSLIRAGFETHYFNPGFQTFSLAETQSKDPSGKAVSPGNLSYWSLARALDKKLPANTGAYIFTSNRQNKFIGDRPYLRSKIIWDTYNPADTIYNSILKAYVTQRDSIRFILAQSQSTGLIYTRENTSLTTIDPAYELIKGKETGIRFTPNHTWKKDIDSSLVVIDTSVVHIALFTDKYPADLAYLKAALQTIQKFSQRKISIKAYRNPSELPERLDWLFWLSESPLKESIRNKSENTLSYQPGNTLALDKSWILACEEDSYDLKYTVLSKRISITNANRQQNALWIDDAGNPVLTRTVDSGVTVFKFYSRFDPEWNDLVWDPRFPATMLNLILPVPEKTNNLESNDRQILSNLQIKPATNEDQGIANNNAEVKETRLDKYFWILLMSLFALERWVSGRQNSTATNG